MIGYNDNDVVIPLYLRVQQMAGYARTFNQNIIMSPRVNSNSVNFQKITIKYGRKLKSF